MCKGIKKMFTFFLFMCCFLFTAPFLNNMLYADPISGSSISRSVEKLWPSLTILDLPMSPHDLEDIHIRPDFPDPLTSNNFLQRDLYDPSGFLEVLPVDRRTTAFENNVVFSPYDS